jgi:signal peptidase I
MSSQPPEDPTAPGPVPYAQGPGADAPPGEPWSTLTHHATGEQPTVEAPAAGGMTGSAGYAQDPQTAADGAGTGGGGVMAPPQESPTPAPSHKPKKSSGLRSLIEWVVIIAVALIGAVVIRTVLFQAFFIPSASMTPTLKVHDRILVNKLAYDFHSVHRGDIVVFKRSALKGISEGNIKDLVKRVIALPGETIETTPDGQVQINGQTLKSRTSRRARSPAPGSRGR